MTKLRLRDTQEEGITAFSDRPLHAPDIMLYAEDTPRILQINFRSTTESIVTI